MKRRNFLINTGIIGAGLAIAPISVAKAITEKTDYSKKSVDELRNLIGNDLEKVGISDKRDFGKDFEWYSRGKDNGSPSKIIMLGDYHKESSEGYYKNVFDSIKKYLFSLGIEGAEYGAKDVLKAEHENLSSVALGSFSFEEFMDESKIRQQIKDSNLPLFGIEDKNSYLAHGCAVGIYEAIARMIIEGSKNNLEKVLMYDDEIKKLEKRSPIKLPHYDLGMFQDGRFDDYWNNLINLITEKFVEDRSVYSSKAINNYIKSTKGSIVSGVLYGAKHRDKFLNGLNNQKISNIYIGSKKLEREYNFNP